MASVLVRGSTVFFSATCLDKDGAPVTPNTANLYLTFKAAADGVHTRVTVPLSVAANVVSAAWESSVAADGLVHWSIRASGSSTIVQDGEITLSANEANPS